MQYSRILFIWRLPGGQTDTIPMKRMIAQDPGFFYTHRAFLSNYFCSMKKMAVL